MWYLFSYNKRWAIYKENEKLLLNFYQRANILMMMMMMTMKLDPREIIKVIENEIEIFCCTCDIMMMVIVM